LLAQRQAQGFVAAKNFANQLTQDQNLMAQAQYPKQYMQISTDAKNATQALRLMGTTYNTLTSFRNAIQQLEASHIDVIALKQLDADKAMLNKARAINDFLKVSSQIDMHMNAIQIPLLQGEANYLLKQFHQEADSWGGAHQYHDAYDGISYKLDYEYDQQGIGS